MISEIIKPTVQQLTDDIRGLLLDEPDITAEQILCAVLNELIDSVYSGSKHSDVVEVLGALELAKFQTVEKFKNAIS